MRVSEVEEVVVVSRSLETLLGERRIVENLDLIRGRGDTVRLVVSLPTPLPDHPIPVMIILGGLDVGEQTLGFIRGQGPNAYVAYRYPYDPARWRERAKVTEVPVIREAVLSVPGQVSATLQWVREQSWADADHASLLGFSLGAILLPATYRVAAQAAPPSPPAVFAYGGADVHMLIDSNLDVHPAWLRSVVARLVQLALRPLEPGLHAPKMEGGPFLLINGNRDEQIPRASYLALQALVPEPKEVLMLDEGHMHPRRMDLTRRLVDLTREWLAVEGFYDPTEAPRLETIDSGP